MPAPLRIAVVNQAAQGGATAAAREIVAFGPSRGLDVRYFPERKDEQATDLLSALDTFRPDVVHAHCWYNQYPYETILELADRAPLAITVHDAFPVNQYGVECWECYRNSFCFGCPALARPRRWRPNYRMRDRHRKRKIHRRLQAELVVPSAWMARRLARSELAHFRQTVIPYGIDIDAYVGVPAARSAFELPHGVPIVLFVGNMYSADDHRKGLPDLLEAFRVLRATVPGAVLAIAGTLRGFEATGPGVRVLGDVAWDLMPSLFASVDVVALPTRGDNLPLAVLEAMAAGRPVVATRVGGIPEAVVDDLTGLLVPPRDPAALAAALGALVADPARREALGAAARERTWRCFSRERVGEAHAALYRRLSEGAAAQPRLA